MKSTLFKKLIAALLAVVMVLGVVGCGKTENESVTTTDPAKVEVEVSQETGVTFPLKEEVTFDIMISYDGDANEAMKNVPFWQELYEKTNVKINLISLPSDSVTNNMNALFTAGKAGDAIMNNIISETDIVSLASNGFLIPIEEYIENPEIMPNFNKYVLAKSPATKGYITAADGHIYALPRYQANPGSYLEAPLKINKKWLDELGMELPTTIAELEACLIAFRDNDVNGNGDKNDEVPLIFLNGGGEPWTHMEALLGMWGLATKDNANDHFCDVDDGKVIFVPTSEAYKDAVKTLAHWWEEGLIWSEAYTGNQESLFATMISDGETALFGVCPRNFITEAMEQQFVTLPAISADGYEAEWFYNPGSLGNKSKFFVTNSCENPEVLMAWIDLFYDFDNGIRISMGEEGLGWEKTADGIVEIMYDNEEQTSKKNASTARRIFGDCPGAFTADDYLSGRLGLSSYDKALQENYVIYQNVIDDDIWPRPYMTEESSLRLGELRTDIINTVSLYKANWVTGVSDIDAEWDSYVEALKKMGLDEYVGILQAEYDAYSENSK